jgi:hypothetical protein
MFQRKICTAPDEPVDSDVSRSALVTTLMPFSSRSLHAGALPIWLVVTSPAKLPKDCGAVAKFSENMEPAEVRSIQQTSETR